MLNRPEEAPTHPPGAIFHVNPMPSLPEFRYEYHPGVKKVYAVQIVADDSRAEEAELIWDHVQDSTHAQVCILLWARGYKFAKEKLTIIGVRHHG